MSAFAKGRSGRFSAMLLPLLLLLAVPTAAHAASRLVLALGLEGVYDDNILQYSDEQIQIFESGTRPTRYSIESTDDGVFSPSASLTYEREREHHRTTRVRARLSWDVHARNSTADDHAGSLSWREDFGARRSITVAVYRLPRYYLRQLFDEDVVNPGTTKYRRADFDLTTGSATWRERLGRRGWAIINYTYERRDYNEAFTERTSNTNAGGLGYEWNSPHNAAGFALNAGYRDSRARAEDGDSIPNDDQDVSYRGAILGVGGRVTIARGSLGRLSADAAYEYRTRDYTSDVPNDPNHNGRNDHLHNIAGGFRLATPVRLILHAFYEYEDNSASYSGPILPTSDSSSYTQGRVGFDIDWSAVIWSRE